MANQLAMAIILSFIKLTIILLQPPSQQVVQQQH